ncbi:MAG: MFS transporter [Paracoccus hibiscisoli]|uniref:MFS transporter n=1 Tax=Paracoccus hibiscisoli TaxID=2023261 RepID=UPI00391AECF4
MLRGRAAISSRPLRYDRIHIVRTILSPTHNPRKDDRDAAPQPLAGSDHRVERPVRDRDRKSVDRERLSAGGGRAAAGAGGLGDRLGHKRIFLSDLVVFGVASTVAAFSPTAGALIGARVVLEVGAAMMMPATLSLIRLTFTDEKKRAFAIGIWAAVASGGAALGPVVGASAGVGLVGVGLSDQRAHRRAGLGGGALVLVNRRPAHPPPLI